MTGSDREEKEAAGKEPPKEDGDDEEEDDSEYEEEDDDDDDVEEEVTDDDDDQASSATEVTIASVEKKASDPPHCLVFGYPSFKVWRCCFYGLMAYQVATNRFGPFGAPFDPAMTYNHAEWVYDWFAPRTVEANQFIRVLCIISALASIFNNRATIVLAILLGQHVFTTITMFINHDYLFFLIALQMAICCNCGENNTQGRAAWIHALRGQIIVVYFFASLWKTDPDWLSGQIVKNIFLSFEEQGVNRGVPWHALYNNFPWIFKFVGLSGLLLDFSLFVVLMFLPPGHKLQSMAFLFHGFTGYTMSQRIGYAFPLAMIFSGLLFLPMGVIETDQVSVGGDSLSHIKWLKMQTKKPSKKRVGALLFLLLQWLIPLRMPIVSNGEFRYTLEGYRWSWTMMLHSKKAMQSPGLCFMTLTPKCGNLPPYPNPMAKNTPFIDVHGIPWEPAIISLNKQRSLAVIQMFAGMMPKVANYVFENFMGQKSCPLGTPELTASYFSSTNNGPFHRIIDPTVNLLDVYKAHSKLPWLSKLWNAIRDKAPAGKQFILRGSGSIGVPIDLEKVHKGDDKGEIVLVDRSPCLQVDPIRIHSNAFELEFDSDSPIDFRLSVKGCQGLDRETNCQEMHLEKGNKIQVPPFRTVSIGIDARRDLGGTSCSETKQEDVVIKLTNVQAQPALSQM